MRLIYSIVLVGIFATNAYASDVVARETLRSGTTLRAQDLKASGSISLDQYIGKSLKRSVYKGSRITLRDIRAPFLVRRNTKVTMIYRRGSLQIKTIGRALDNGSDGEMIEVMNVDSKTRITATVIANNTVEVAL